MKLSPPPAPVVPNGFALAIVCGVMALMFAICGGVPTSAGAMFIALSIGLAIAAVVCLIRIPEWNERRKKELRIWKLKMYEWGESFYCSRCDGVFISGDRKLRSCDTLRN
jgi:hypothetical protein